MKLKIVIHEDCKGPNKHCRAAHREGRTVHAYLEGRLRRGNGLLVMPTYHYRTVQGARAAITAAAKDAVIIRDDAALYAAREAGRPHILPRGWTDPTMRSRAPYTGVKREPTAGAIVVRRSPRHVWRLRGVFARAIDLDDEVARLKRAKIDCKVIDGVVVEIVTFIDRTSSTLFIPGVPYAVPFKICAGGATKRDPLRFTGAVVKIGIIGDEGR